MWPSDATLFLVPCVADAQVARVDFWKSVYGFDFSPLQDVARKEFHRVPLYNHKLCEADCLAAPQEVMTLTLKSLVVEDLEFHSQAFSFTVRQDGILHGFASWFDVGFCGIGSEERASLSTGPDQPRTHWNQDLCMLDTYTQVWTGDVIGGTLTISRNTEWRRHLHVTIDYSIQREGETVISASKRFGLWK